MPSKVNPKTIRDHDATPGNEVRKALTILVSELNGRELTRGTLAATGTNLATAAPIVARVTSVTAADGTKGVVLPATAITAATDPASNYYIYNSVATLGLKVYAPTGVSINGGSTGGSVTIEGKTLSHFLVIDATNYATVFTADV